MRSDARVRSPHASGSRRRLQCRTRGQVVGGAASLTIAEICMQTARVLPCRQGTGGISYKDHPFLVHTRTLSYCTDSFNISYYELHSRGANQQASHKSVYDHRRSCATSRGFTSAMPAFWEGIGYLMEGDQVDRRRRGRSGSSGLSLIGRYTIAEAATLCACSASDHQRVNGSPQPMDIRNPRGVTRGISRLLKGCLMVGYQNDGDRERERESGPPEISLTERNQTMLPIQRVLENPIGNRYIPQLPIRVYRVNVQALSSEIRKIVGVYIFAVRIFSFETLAIIARRSRAPATVNPYSSSLFSNEFVPVIIATTPVIIATIESPLHHRSCM
ncbi:hypothetical protein EVAR_38108_1 [Eumeta japonica]|uniref:Uncharacterized protein n=1 Tax=Eumeta variegata TaxID=151549 RepID=A0A4C1X8T5_EUMVA|nr:hypothetical protein EVAR_38108_1 [Eumeta japonica]